mgnify:CR=1 FL=1
MRGNTQGGGVAKREVNNKKSPKKSKNNQFILFIQEKWVPFVVGSIGSLFVWLFCNVINIQVLTPINELRGEKIQKIDNLEKNYHELDKRITLLESNSLTTQHSPQNIAKN